MRVAIALVCAGSAGCYLSHERAAVDAGALEAGAHDAATPDAGTPDAGAHDTGPPDAGPPPPALVCYTPETVFDAPVDGACHDFALELEGETAPSCSLDDLGERARAFRIAHPTTVASASAVVRCAPGVACFGAIEMPYVFDADCTMCGWSGTSSPAEGGAPIDLVVALIDAMDGPMREPEYGLTLVTSTVGAPPIGITVTICTVAP